MNTRDDVAGDENSDIVITESSQRLQKTIIPSSRALEVITSNIRLRPQDSIEGS